jgi:hypothetical protein
VISTCQWKVIIDGIDPNSMRSAGRCSESILYSKLTLVFVVELWGEKFANRYQLLTKHSILEDYYPTRQLLRVSEDCCESINGIILAVEAAQLREENHTVRKWESRATVKERAQDVVDEKNRLQCSVHCHSDDHDCGNSSELSCLFAPAEMALVERGSGADDHGAIGGVHV